MGRGQKKTVCTHCTRPLNIQEETFHANTCKVAKHEIRHKFDAMMPSSDKTIHTCSRAFLIRCHEWKRFTHAAGHDSSLDAMNESPLPKTKKGLMLAIAEIHCEEFNLFNNRILKLPDGYISHQNSLWYTKAKMDAHAHTLHQSWVSSAVI